ncbi:DUF4168 domain-containing protein [Ancylothrix sp. C2]|uniref:DUF4168 domain-containing protein n=1 Tax=Ancylothrix sp. D3o TaxID=2953691 RepID=UPI0021BAEDD0|nr:DUF4168 domain-containing protein [Ancylothrix sp. D3o]MCT7951745.1 DUF4168 domain-containing protein [Ancylothrix sp. D3o]
MMRLVACESKMKLNQWLSKPVLICLLAGVGVGAGAVPSFLEKQPLLGVGVAVAQNFSDQEITSYARTVLKLEQVRLQAYDDIKQKIGSGDIPNIVCNQAETLNALNAEVRPIAINYCNSSKQIVETNGLTSTKFNAITASQQNNPALQKRIQDEITRLQKALTKFVK